MARKKILRIGALNIKTQPHSEQRYLDLFMMMFNKTKKGIKIRGSDWGMIGTLQTMNRNGNDFYIGRVYKFLNIDPDKAWLNTDTRKPEKDENGAIVKPVADNLKPNLRESYYAFFPKQHRMIYEINEMSPGMMLKLMTALFNRKSIVGRFGNVDIEMETSIEAIDIILQIPTLRKIEIGITKPNPGDVLDEDDEAEVFRRFDRIKARKLQENWSGQKGESLLPDEEMKKLMRVASSNGLIMATGYGRNDEKVVESTQDHPRTMTDEYDPNIQTTFSFFQDMASRFLRQLTRI
ncbi:DUF4747 family protein [bacterium]|nr:MAG: DUF4747 family protein [bacterium]